jgi:hypothetical protein
MYALEFDDLTSEIGVGGSVRPRLRLVLALAASTITRNTLTVAFLVPFDVQLDLDIWLEIFWIIFLGW